MTLNPTLTFLTKFSLSSHPYSHPIHDIGIEGVRHDASTLAIGVNVAGPVMIGLSAS